LSALAMICEPMRLSGLITLAIGRFRSESSPVSTEKKGFPESTPEMSLIVVPEFPQSTMPCGSDRPRSPFPSIVSIEPPSRISTPRLRNAFAVLSVSWALRKFFTTLLPSAREERMTALWEIDLSEGGKNSP
jgi:hypothetical protein